VCVFRFVFLVLQDTAEETSCNTNCTALSQKHSLIEWAGLEGTSEITQPQPLPWAGCPHQLRVPRASCMALGTSRDGGYPRLTISLWQIANVTSYHRPCQQTPSSSLLLLKILQTLEPYHIQNIEQDVKWTHGLRHRISPLQAEPSFYGCAPMSDPSAGAEWDKHSSVVVRFGCDFCRGSGYTDNP